ncbi:PREDICTED: trichohyalin [Nelumbo nucifera]|uniref:Trichohyalin n=2 Tax=Nelumbo nucifera TaxID=4432 RepID=A0A1U8BCN4_NELNU|nr:PREDICTED: trichohyalin [Nelumbo nucifera]DAD21095.1 TPA_asm: hypothetical protein HUJ06_022558 [Nelumbo nucifera]
MESERPHRSGSTGSELFICFTSRLSSSSMKISSKSMLSPGRTDKFREPSSLSSSLSRRLRSHGSMRGGQASPMFPTGNKKRGSTFDTAEPSSPKVTCIGQVRVKTKKHGKKMRTRSKRCRNGSFRRTEQIQDGVHPQQHQECLPHRNQRWVHIPLSICEALRAFGAEFNCFLPCRSSCTSTNEREKAEKARTSPASTPTSSCGTVFARWLLALQDSEEEKRREMELVVREEEKRKNLKMVHVIDIEEKGEAKEVAGEEEEGRVSICVPPKNALLLMRCRSDPVKMASLANRYWESSVTKAGDDEDDDEDGEDDNEDDRIDEQQKSEGEEGNGEKDEDEEEFREVIVQLEEDQGQMGMSDKRASIEEIGEHQNPQKHEKFEMQEYPTKEEEEKPDEEQEENPEKQQERKMELTKEEILVNGSSAESPEEPKNQEKERSDGEIEQDAHLTETIKEAEEARRASVSSSSSRSSQDPEAEPGGPRPTLADPVAALEEGVEKSIKEKGTEKTYERYAKEQQLQQQENHEHDEGDRSKVREEDSVLPDCLLLMMYEPKLSMEVSKETWVCSTDFVRCRPSKQTTASTVRNGGDECKRRVSTDTNPGVQVQQQKQRHHRKQPLRPLPQAARKSCSNPVPARKSCSNGPPAAPSMANMIEQKLVNAEAYEPFVLTRCKSEPMRSSAKHAQESCFWNNGKLEYLEPHRPTIGIGAAGIGY